MNIWGKRARLGGLMGKRAFVKFYLMGFCSCCVKRDKLSTRQYKTYLNSKRKFSKELDVIALLRSVRLSKVLLHTTLNRRQAMLM